KAPYSDIMQEAEVSLVSRDTCNSSEQYATLIREEHLCAISEDPTKGSCRGDGGGPLMCRESHTERYWLIGLNSWGTGCSSGRVPGVFTSTQFFLTWIKDIMANPPASGLSPPFRPTTPRTPTPPPPSRFTGAYYLNPIYKKVNGRLVGYFPAANTYSLPTRTAAVGCQTHHQAQVHRTPQEIYTLHLLSDDTPVGHSHYRLPRLGHGT
ncbi:acrosin-like, partial [Pantherophis guttatus]|uniref:Acrosin-like n=1 Tax=Pantherophis guttatus TaxID=94885 RepID=A0ABM3ZD56_PANGU